jgi:cobalt/nickel transport system permease protein
MLWAVHIPDGVLTEPWLIGGFVLAVALGLASFLITRFRDEDISRIALLTAAFFVASLIHVRIPPTSVHLLLNGLLGVILGWQAAIAIPLGLFLQAALFNHGGFTSWGVNSCVMVLPALLAWAAFHGIRRMPGVRRPGFRAALVVLSMLLWVFSAVYGCALLAQSRSGQLSDLDLSWANRLVLHPVIIAASVLTVVLLAYLERRLGNGPEFPLGLFVGVLAVLATILLNCAVMAWGGQEDWHTLALVTLVAHLPIAVIEGVVLGFVVSFLARVKPELVGWAGAVQGTAAVPREVELNGRSAHALSSDRGYPPCPAPQRPGDLRSVQSGQGTSS